jgi:3-oxoacyl-[acyl-carrier-protein] synthase III
MGNWLEVRGSFVNRWLSSRMEKALACMTATQEKNELTRNVVYSKISGVKIVGLGMGYARKQVPNEELSSIGCDSEWIVQRTGIQTRYHAEADQATSDLAYDAAVDCLNRSGVAVSEVDMIIVATMTPDHYTPSTSCLVQSRLGAKCGAVDMNAACSGFMYGLIFGSQLVRSGCSRYTLVIGADKMSCVVDPQDPKTYPLFGDGAAAALITADPREPSRASGILAYQLGSAGELGGTLVVPGCGSRLPASPEVLASRDQYLKMDGRSVFKWAVRLIPELVNDLLAEAQLTLADIDLLIFHQANRRILDAAAEALGADPAKVFMNLDRFGNTSAASIPIALYEASNQGRIRPGGHVLTVGFGAGLTWGASIIRW